MNRTDVLAVTVTYNRKEKLLKCLEALAQSEPRPDILVIDNASTDDTAEAVAAFGEKHPVIYRNTGANLGGAGGFHFGMKAAAEAGYRYIWIMDDDCIPEKNTLSALLRADEALSGNYGFLSSVAYWTDGALCNMNIQKTGLKEKVSDYTSPQVPIIMATFVSMLVKRETVLEMGLPIRDFFIWADDLEYTRRLSRKYPCYMIPSSRVLHDMGSNAKVNIAADSDDRLSRYACLYRNEVFVYRREGFRGWIYLYSRLCLHLARILLNGTGSKAQKMKTVLKSFHAGHSFRPEIEYIGDAK